MPQTLIYLTFGSPEEARRIARTLVEERLLACANVLDGATSIYRWRGAVEEARETVVFGKTDASGVDALAARVKQLHSYDTPCVVAAPLVGGDADFLAWIGEETQARRDE